MGSVLGVSESASAEFSFFTPSAPPSTYTFKLIRSWQLIAAQSGFDDYFGVADNAGVTGCAANPAWLMGKQCSTFTRNCRQTSEDRLRRFTSRFVLDHIPVSLGSSSFINIPSDKFRHLQSRSLSGLPQ